jgi:mannose-6-phosphate isomerase-like protein (cupin superfamily)
MPERRAVLGKDEGEIYRLGTIDIVVKEDGSLTRGTHSVAEFRGARFRIPPHVHTRHDETIYVVEGEMGLRLGSETYALRAGSSFAIPLDVPHSIWNETDVPVRFLNIIAPADYLSYFHELSLAAAGGRPSPEVIREVMAKWGLAPTA